MVTTTRYNNRHLHPKGSLKGTDPCHSFRSKWYVFFKQITTVKWDKTLSQDKF